KADSRAKFLQHRAQFIFANTVSSNGVEQGFSSALKAPISPALAAEVNCARYRIKKNASAYRFLVFDVVCGNALLQRVDQLQGLRTPVALRKVPGDLLRQLHALFPRLFAL